MKVIRIIRVEDYYIRLIYRISKRKKNSLIYIYVYLHIINLI